MISKAGRNSKGCPGGGDKGKECKKIAMGWKHNNHKSWSQMVRVSEHLGGKSSCREIDIRITFNGNLISNSKYSLIQTTKSKLTKYLRHRLT